MNFTKEQQQAIDARDGQILVAAAAGSGKTAVLVHRILTLIKEKTDIDRMLVVTFTEAAAAEMKERIGDALAELLEINPDDENLLRQSARLPAASISTIHAFCLKLVKDHFHRIDLDPAFRIGDQTELNLLQSQVMEALFEGAYARDEDNKTPSFSSLVETFGGGKTRDIRLDRLIRRLFGFIESQPFPQEAIEKYISIFDDNTLNSSIWVKIVREEMALALDGALTIINRAKNLCLLPGGPEKYLLALQEDESLVHYLQKILQNDTGLDELYDTFSKIKHTAIHTYRGKEKEAIDEELRLQVKDMRDKDIKKRIEKIKTRFLFTNPDKMREDIHNLQPVIKALFDLTLDYRARYNEEKRARNLVDFSDLEHYAIQILWEGDFRDQTTLTPSPVAAALANKYEEVLIDEYQDTNEVQERILSAVTSPRRFMVGDVKQSIYGFRHAQPKLFTEKYNNPDINTIVLSKNFRSRGQVLDAVNFFFERLMSKAAGDIEYDNKAALYLGAEFPETEWDFTTELHIADTFSPQEDSQKEFGQDLQKGLKEGVHINKEEVHIDSEDNSEKSLDNEDTTTIKIRHEARLIANRIHSLVGKMPVRDSKAPGGLRPCRHGDIVVLTRSVRSIAASLTEELKQQGIHAVAETPGGFFETPEIMIALSLLKIVDNPRQDIDLLAVLRLYGFTPDEMLAIRLCGDTFHSDTLGDKPKKDIDYYDCLPAYIESGSNTDLRSRLIVLLEDINQWRKKAIILPISRLIGVLYEETGLPYRFGAMAGGAVRQANLQLLLEKAIQYETTSFTGLFHFVRYIEWLQTNAEDESAAMILPEDDTVVRVMTIHKSKGLEFPVVFVSMLGRQFNKMDERFGVILHPALGVGAMYTDLEKRTRSNTISRLALALLRQREAVSEELRVLYVAMTRAKEKLILTGCVTNLEDQLEKWQALSDVSNTSGILNISDISDTSDIFSAPAGLLPLYALREAKSYLDWLVPCALQPSQQHIKLCIYQEGLPASDLFLEKILAPEEILALEKGSVTEKESAHKEHEEIEVSSPEKESNLDKKPILKEESSIQQKGIIGEESSLRQKGIIGEESTLPSKLAISELKRIYALEISPDSTTAYEDDNIFEAPLFYKAAGSQITPLRMGAILHTIVEHMDLHRDRDAGSIKNLIASLVNIGLLSQEEAKAVNIDKLTDFAASSLAHRMRAARKLYREVPFVIGLSPEEVYGDYNKEAEGTDILVHGIIDCYFETEAGEIVLVDFKSDANPDTLQVRYATQMKIYRRAIEKATGKPVAESLFYSFA